MTLNQRMLELMLNTPAADNEVIMIIITSIWTLYVYRAIPITHYNALAFILIHILKVK